MTLQLLLFGLFRADQRPHRKPFCCPYLCEHQECPTTFLRFPTFTAVCCLFVFKSIECIRWKRTQWGTGADVKYVIVNKLNLLWWTWKTMKCSRGQSHFEMTRQVGLVFSCQCLGTWSRSVRSQSAPATLQKECSEGFNVCKPLLCLPHSFGAVWYWEQTEHNGHHRPLLVADSLLSHTCYPSASPSPALCLTDFSLNI